MNIRFAISPGEARQFNTEQLRENFLVSSLMQDDTVQLVYTHYDRVIIGGAKPVNKSLSLPNHSELKADYFLERRELGIIISLPFAPAIMTDEGAGNKYYGF